MSQGEGGGRPRKHPYPQASGQIAMDAEWQEIADGRTEAIEAYNKYGTANALAPIVDDDDRFNSKTAALILVTREIAKNANVDDIDSLYACLEEYIKYCIEHNIRITNGMAYSACGLNRFIVKDWALGVTRSSDPAYREFAQTIRSICYESREMLMSEGKLNPIVGIWWQKNYDGFKDKPNDQDEVSDDDDTLSASQIAEKYSGIGDD